MINRIFDISSRVFDARVKHKLLCKRIKERIVEKVTCVMLTAQKIWAKIDHSHEFKDGR